MNSARPANRTGPDLFERRVPHTVVGYLGVSWGLIEATQFSVARYKVPDWSLDVVVALLVASFPAALILAWRHGLPGKQRFLVREIVAAGVAFLLRAGRWRRAPELVAVVAFFALAPALLYPVPRYLAPAAPLLDLLAVVGVSAWRTPAECWP